MLLAHLVPGYFAAALTQPHWDPRWSFKRRALLWGVALGSTVLPDLDVVYNTLFRGFINHSLLWTHSVFLYTAIGVIWFALYRAHRWFYVQLILGLIALGGLSHIILDILSHGTPLFYPVSMLFVGIAPHRVIAGGFWAYITDPIFLIEPLLIAGALAHIVWHQPIPRRVRAIALAAVSAGWLVFTSVFLVRLSDLQAFALTKIVP